MENSRKFRLYWALSISHTEPAAPGAGYLRTAYLGKGASNPCHRPALDRMFSQIFTGASFDGRALIDWLSAQRGVSLSQLMRPGFKYAPRCVLRCPRMGAHFSGRSGTTEPAITRVSQGKMKKSGRICTLTDFSLVPPAACTFGLETRINTGPV